MWKKFKRKLVKILIISIIILIIFMYLILNYHQWIFDFFFWLLNGFRFFYRGYKNLVFNAETHSMLFCFFILYSIVWRLTIYYILWWVPWYRKCYYFLYQYFFCVGIYFLREFYLLAYCI